MVASLFPLQSEASFSNVWMWKATGTLLAFSYSAYICTLYKLIILTAFLTLGMAGFIVVEMTERKRRTKLALEHGMSNESGQKPEVMEMKAEQTNNAKIANGDVEAPKINYVPVVDKGGTGHSDRELETDVQNDDFKYSYDNTGFADDQDSWSTRL